MKPFLTANWRYLAMLNYVVDPALIEPLTPAGTEIATFELNADVATLCGEQFAETLSQSPRSAFIADGSPITVQKREVLLSR